MKNIKRRNLFFISVFIFILGSTIFHWIFKAHDFTNIDYVSVKRIVNEAQENFPQIEKGNYDFSPYPFAIVDTQNKLLYSFRENIIPTISHAIKNQYTMLNITKENQIVGIAFIDTSIKTNIGRFLNKMEIIIISVFGLLILSFSLYFYIINKNIIKPFKNLQQFATEVSNGNLDFPLTMDQHNIFGAFTESFDIMRQELLKSKQQEYLANQSKKELVASLSHDIKTPVTSIKITSELLLLLIEKPDINQKISTIYQNAEQINALVTDLFHSTLEDMGELSVSPVDTYSDIIRSSLKKADYYDRIVLMQIADCMIYVDPLRLDQILCNIINNAYKYSEGKIEVVTRLNTNTLEVHIKNYGSSVAEEELPLIFNKFYRGRNAEGKSGTGLGLYISQKVLALMESDIYALNEADGFKIIITLKLSS